MSEILLKLKQNDFVFKKKFGQNFITDKNLLDAIVNDAEITSEDEVLEIGTGAGTLTKAIAEKSKKIVTLEIDNSLRDFLKNQFDSINNIELYFADFMKVDASEVNSKFTKPFKVVANLPYYITTPIIFKLVEEKYSLKSITIMVQKEVAERLVAKSGTKDYGSISVQLQAIADLEITRIVKRQMFSPQPNVDSAVVNIKFNPKKFDIKNIKVLKRVIDVAFSMRRKTLSNCFKTKMGLTEDQITKLFNKLNLSLTIRGEALSVEDFVKLSNAVCEMY